MPILQPSDEEAVRSRFDAELEGDVNLTLFTQRNLGGLFIPGRECQSCAPTQQLLEEVSELSSKVHLNVVNFFDETEEARANGVYRIPATVIGDGGNGRVRFFGLPSGYEFASFLDAVVEASGAGSSLAEETRSRLDSLDEDIHIQVFVTPT